MHANLSKFGQGVPLREENIAMVPLIFEEYIQNYIKVCVVMCPHEGGPFFDNLNDVCDSL